MSQVYHQGFVDGGTEDCETVENSLPHKVGTTRPSQQTRSPSTPPPPLALVSDPTPVHRLRLICNPIQILGGRSVSLNTFKQDFQVFQGRANEMFRKQMKKGNMTKARLHLLCMAFLQPTSITHLTSLIPFFERLYTKCFQLSDVLDYVKTGVAAIIEDEVSDILPF